MKTQSLIFQSASRVLFASAMILLTACQKDNPTFSILSDSQSFKQASSSVNSKVDVLWVVDNSGSMGPLQTNLTNNFASFIASFVSKGYDFQMAVTTSDAYLANAAFDNFPSMAKFRDGLGPHTNVFVINPLTPNLNNTFVTNATTGEAGSGDERVLSSMRESLNSSLNSGFVRTNSYLAVIILSDEDDFSSINRPEGSWTLPGGVSDHNYAYAGLDTVDSYVSYLDTKTNSSPTQRRYSVSAITVLDAGCRTAHAAAAPSTIIGQRYIDLANKTNGALGSICDVSYASTLNAFQEHVLELSTQFYLSRIPVVNSIVVTVNGAFVANDASNGWTYDSTANSIVFHGTAIPAADATVNVAFDPTTVL